VGRRTLAIALAILITALPLFTLLYFNAEKEPEREEVPISVVSIEAAEIPADAPEPSPPERAQAETKPTPTPPEPLEPLPPQPVEAKPAPPIPPPPIPSPKAPAVAPIGVRPPSGQVYGPPNKRGSSASGDSVAVGTAPNGEPMYGAAWYREPSDDELRGYLSTASGPGWGLIACRTAADYRVEDCVGLDEYPNGSQIMRAVLGAAWQFRVRPPRRGGQPMVGAWVRIKIDYGIKRR